MWRIGIVLIVMLAGCASYSGSGLVAGQAGEAEVIHTMGPPAMRWANPDGSLQLAYPRGPMGVHTYMVQIGPDGRLRRIENVLAPAGFARVQAGMTADEVLRQLGPPEPSWTAYFPRRDELVWEWRYCDDWNQRSRFDVLFDGTTKTVRSTMTRREACGRDGCWCSR